MALHLSAYEMLGYGEAHGEAMKTIIKKTQAFLIAPLYHHVRCEHEYQSGQYSCPDSAIHLVLFCIPPNSLGLSTKDRNFLTSIKDLAFILPVITKADSYTTEELQERKYRLRRDLENIGIPMLPDSKDSYYADLYEEISQKYPLAVISSTNKIKSPHGLVRARAYPWGLIDIDDDNYNDLGLLQKVLFKSLLTKFHAYAYEHVYHQYRRRIITDALANGNMIPSIPEDASSSTDQIANIKAFQKLRLSFENVAKLNA